MKGRNVKKKERNEDINKKQEKGIKDKREKK